MPNNLTIAEIRSEIAERRCFSMGDENRDSRLFLKLLDALAEKCSEFGGNEGSMNKANANLTTYRNSWRLWAVAKMAEICGVLIHVEGIPFGSNRLLKYELSGSAGSQSGSQQNPA